MLLRVILATDKPSLQGRLRQLLEGFDVAFDVTKSRDQLWEQVSKDPYDVILMSRRLLSEPPTEFLRALRDLPESPEVVVLTRRRDPEEVAQLVAEGCLAVLDVELSNKLLSEAIGSILDRRVEFIESRQVGGRSARSKPRLANMVTNSPDMKGFMNIVNRVVASDTSLLITGETGVGKEWLARAIHAESPRATGPFIAVNCGALPESLLESELFGHEEGAFTGATRSRRGRFEQAHGGTIFLDEIGDMPPHLQVKLLTVLQSREIQPVGSESPLQVDVRIMAATNIDLDEAVQEKTFRRDLYYRLSVVTLAVPPLRKRVEDIPELATNYIHYYASVLSKDVVGITEDAMRVLCAHDWPGNVRELMNVIERAALLCDGSEITLPDLPMELGGMQHLLAEGVDFGNINSPLPDAYLNRTWKEVRSELLFDLERRYFIGLLERTEGRIDETAKLAGIQPRSLYEKMKEHDLKKEDFKQVRSS